jgi:hypothetical protein
MFKQILHFPGSKSLFKNADCKNVILVMVQVLSGSMVIFLRWARLNSGLVGPPEPEVFSRTTILVS